VKFSLDYLSAAPAAIKALYQLSASVKHSGLEPRIIELIQLRVSQINHCGYCIDMHTKDLRAAGETEQRLYLLSVWPETTLFNERECAALAWAEATAVLTNREFPEDLLERTRKVFSDAEIVWLSMAVTMISAWNRLNVPFHPEVGGYQVGMFANGPATATATAHA